MNEIIWAGLALDAKSLAVEVFTRLNAGQEDRYGSRTIVHYQIRETDVVVISIEGARVGIGILCVDEAQAREMVPLAKAALSHLNIPGEMSGWKMYSLPKAA